MNERTRKRWGCLESDVVTGGVVLLAIFLLGSWFLKTVTRVSVVGDGPKAINNCKQIILSLKQYATYEGGYPDDRRPGLRSANEVFRELFRQEIISDERIFTCPNSIFATDNDIGSAPGFEKAVMPGECHWMLLKNRSENEHDKTPLVIENSLNAAWPPRWDVSAQAGSKRGRACPERRIIVGRMDGTVTLEKLLPDGTLDWHSPNNLGPDGKSWIDALTPEQVAKLGYWDVEEK